MSKHLGPKRSSTQSHKSWFLYFEQEENIPQLLTQAISLSHVLHLSAFLQNLSDAANSLESFCSLILGWDLGHLLPSFSEYSPWKPTLTWKVQ